MQLFHRNSRSWDITAKHTLERIQTNATSATILKSHNPTHAHPQWRETTHTSAQNAKSNSAKLEIWALICSFTQGRIHLLVLSATSHSHKVENWRSTYSSTVPLSVYLYLSVVFVWLLYFLFFVFICLLYLFVCCIYLFVVFICLLCSIVCCIHLFVSCIYLFVSCIYLLDVFFYFEFF